MGLRRTMQRSVTGRVVSEFSADERDLLARIQDGLAITADVSRADLLLYASAADRTVVLAQAQPRSISSLYPSTQVGHEASPSERPLVSRALNEGRAGSVQHDLPTGTPVVQEIYPVRGKAGKTIAALSVETNLIAMSGIGGGIAHSSEPFAGCRA